MLYLFIIIPLIPLFVNPNHQVWVVKDSKLYQYIKHVQLKIIKNLFAKKNYYRNLCQTHTNPVSRFLSFILSLYLCFLFCVETQKMFEIIFYCLSFNRPENRVFAQTQSNEISLIYSSV